MSRFSTPNPSDYPEVTAVADRDALMVPRQGAESANFVMIYGEHLGQRFSISGEPLVIGRAAECHIRLADDSVSRQHCQVLPGKDGIVLMDQNSTNGTYVNDTVVSARHLKDGDRVQVGRSIFKFITGDNIEQHYHEEIYRLKTTDGLTGAFNKRYFDEELKREVFRYLRYRRPLALIMIDIDHFKNVNDDYGHLAGDRVLADLAKLLISIKRSEDTFCRYGGEEFTVLMPETVLSEAVERAEMMRSMVERARFEFDGVAIPITISAGVAEAKPSYEESDEFVAASDKKLYEAKNGGRNRVEPPPEP
ncbi:MAG: GGDEF domain-containing protein [Deltaproteobacteria bacterium]|nr:GGDEF domain-containing protein [Deltaproteobacteria bacterium]